MKKVNFVATKNTVKADGYVIRQLYKANAELVEELGGEMVKDKEVFTAKFKTSANAKKFVEQAKTSIGKRTYNANRKTEPKKVTAGKGKSSKIIVLTDEDGNVYEVPKSALALKTTTNTKKTTKGKGNSKKSMTNAEKVKMAKKMTYEHFGKYVPYAKWEKKYNQILASL